MELDQELADGDGQCEKIVDDGVLRPLDVHLQNVDSLAAEHRHHRAEAMDGDILDLPFGRIRAKDRQQGSRAQQGVAGSRRPLGKSEARPSRSASASA
jgi:hypothetical protein